MKNVDGFGSNIDESLGTWISIGHPVVAEVVARLDLDFVLVDMEHTTISLETVQDMVRAVEAAPGSTEVIVRVPWNDPVYIKRVIDIDVGGVMVPMIGSKKEAENLVDSLMYPPDGTRGVAGSRATGYGYNFEEYVSSANGSILTIAQIETAAGLKNAEKIASVDGIDALFVGPADLSATLDDFGNRDSAEYKDAIDQIQGAGAAADIPVGTLTTDLDEIRSTVERGFDFLIAGKDASELMDSTQTAIDNYRDALDS